MLSFDGECLLIFALRLELDLIRLPTTKYQGESAFVESEECGRTIGKTVWWKSEGASSIGESVAAS